MSYGLLTLINAPTKGRGLRVMIRGGGSENKVNKSDFCNNLFV